MTDLRPRHPTEEPDLIDKPDPPLSRNVPKLVWIIAVLLVAILAAFFLQWRSTHVTPSGGTMPQTDTAGAVTPPAR